MKNFLSLEKLVCIVAAMLLCTNFVDVQAANDPEIVINYIPPVGKGGSVEGKVVWPDLNAGNAGQYAVIAMLRSSWGADYVKPSYDDYLNAVDAYGNFFINIITGEGDKNISEVSFYFVLRETFNGIGGSSVNAGTMAGKYLGQSLTINRDAFWDNRLQPPASNIHQGFVAAGTTITLSCQAGGTILYTLDGSDPSVSHSALTYNEETVLTVPSGGSLLVRAITGSGGAYSSPASFVWFPEEPLSTPLWGINVSLALNGEPFGYSLSEETTRTRMAPVGKLAKWIRTFGTLNNGLPYINKIAKEMGMRTMIGIYITSDASNNNAQIQGLRNILQTGPAPDLIAVGNETSLAGISPATLATCIDAVREVVKESGYVIPIGSVDLANASWPQFLLDRIDFIGVNIYNGTWDNTPESEMLNALKKTYADCVSTYSSKFVLLTEAGTPHAGGTYSVEGGTQTPSQAKAASYLCGFVDWIKREKIPAFYFEAYDEPVKSQNGGNPIEQYFGLMDGNLQLHSFYDCITTVIQSINLVDISVHPNPTTGKIFLDAESKIKLYSEQGVVLQEFVGNQTDLSAYAKGIYILQVNGVCRKVIKK